MEGTQTAEGKMGLETVSQQQRQLSHIWWESSLPVTTPTRVRENKLALARLH